jgi:exopolyphosphatase / guanosine-5'-triphosphate,3'-diphosphate pyrophosphatase
MSWRSIRAAGAAGAPVTKVAVIDLGSNSWRLVIFSYGSAQRSGVATWWKRTDELYETVRIGAGLQASGRLSEEAMTRGLETLTVFEHFCRANELGRDEVHAVATSAIREAVNGREFVHAAEHRTGLRIEILPAEDEAWLGYLAAVNTTTLADGVVLELGGGSMQLIRVAAREAYERPSFGLGAVSLTEELLPGAGPAKKRDLERVRKRARAALGDLKWLREASRRRKLVGLGGAVRNLAAAAAHSSGAPDLGVQGFVITTDALDALVLTLAELPAAERGTVPGIKPGRGDIILAAALVIQTVVELGGFEGVEVTEAGLREGVFFARTPVTGEGSLIDDVRRAAVLNLALQYESDMAHVERVARLAMQMFDSLVEQGLVEPSPDERDLLWAAAMLHDVGMTIAYDDHHKHSEYLILAGELPGFDPRERALIARITRYHRKGVPRLGELEAVTQDGDQRLLERCAVIVRLAEHLERGHDQAVKDVRLDANGRGVDLYLKTDGESLTLPRWSVERYGDGDAFARVFGRRLVVG